MKCPHCQGSKSKVTETRIDPDNDTVYRGRWCGHCGKMFHTTERVHDGPIPKKARRNHDNRFYKPAELDWKPPCK